MTHFATDRYDLLRLLVPYPTKIEVVRCEDDEPEAWAVWVGEGPNRDIVGSGATRDRALADAIQTASKWESYL